MKAGERLSAQDALHAGAMAVACLLAYWMATEVLSRIVPRDDDLLGGMWAVVATIFVFRGSKPGSLSAGKSRLIATTVSFLLCLSYLLLFPFTPVGMAALLGIGTVVMILLGRREDIITTAITTAVVMVVAAISPRDAWEQPILRFVDTVLGIGVGIVCEFILSHVVIWLSEGSPQSREP